MLGAVLALFASATFGMNIAALRRGVLSGSLLQALVVTITIGVPLFALACLLFGAFDDLFALSHDALFWFALVGVIHFILGRYSNYRATRALGAAQSGPIQQVSLLISLVLAVALLGESLTPLRILGILLILLGPFIILRSRGPGGETRTRAGQRLDYVEGYGWGLVCAAVFGVSPLLIRYGLEDGGVGQGLAGGLVSYSAATVAISLILLLPGNIAEVRTLDAKTAGWFCLTGALVFASQMLIYMALALAPVTVVITIQRTSLVFRTIFSWMINRDHEVINPSILIGIALSVIGVLAVSVSTEQVLALVPLPEWLVNFARLSWP